MGLETLQDHFTFPAVRTNHRVQFQSPSKNLHLSPSPHAELSTVIASKDGSGNEGF